MVVKNLSAEERLARQVHESLKSIGVNDIPLSTIVEVVRVAYASSLRSEETRPVRCCITYADPQNPDTRLTSLIRAMHPKFWSFESPAPFTTDQVAKLSRAIDPWAGSLAVFDSVRGLEIWGFADQRVHFNLGLNTEPEGYGHPGEFTAVVDGTASITVYRDDFLLGALRYDEVYSEQPDAFRSDVVLEKLWPSMRPLARAIAKNAPRDLVENATIDEVIRFRLAQLWDETIRRITIGVQRAGTGGMLLISRRPIRRILSSGYPVSYDRVQEASTMKILYEAYHDYWWNQIDSHAEFLEFVNLLEDIRDRERELTGAVRLISAMATLDGATCMSPTLSVQRFGSKINSARRIGSVYSVRLDRGKLKKAAFDYTKFGTRHASAIRYCIEDPNSVVVIISQDGVVRVATSVGDAVMILENVKLREYVADSIAYRQRAALRSKFARDFGQHYGLGLVPQDIVTLRRRTMSRRIAHYVRRRAALDGLG